MRKVTRGDCATYATISMNSGMSARCSRQIGFAAFSRVGESFFVAHLRDLSAIVHSVDGMKEAASHFVS